ncbi:unnamed protein product [marine sediment metagenome]|uniref:Uncharacterized protein n=1 Tax=marine sediment metagenome TaxID=412755 RepID=X1EF01_9ZZZZ
MKFTIRPRIIMPIPNIVQGMVDLHILQTAQELLDALPKEIERLQKLGHTEIAQKLANLQDTLREAREEPEP